MLAPCWLLDDEASQLIIWRRVFCNDSVSSRSVERFLPSIDAVVAALFEYSRVEALPAASEAWAREHAHVLRHSRAAQDLRDDDVQAILDFDNGNWREQSWTHWCVACAGTCCEPHLQVSAGRAMTEAAKRRKYVAICSLQGGLLVPVLYRWKKFEKAQAWICRGRNQHGSWNAPWR